MVAEPLFSLVQKIKHIVFLSGLERKKDGNRVVLFGVGKMFCLFVYKVQIINYPGCASASNFL